MVAPGGGWPVYGVDGAPDQVVRKQAFEKKHPEWRIFHDKDYDVWRAWRLLEGGEDNVTRYRLKDMMDALEKRV
jgi:hypothetical protein